MLSYHEAGKVYTYAADTPEKVLRARRVGLTLSTTLTQRGRGKVFFTREPYAAVALYREADAGAQANLGTLYSEAQASRAEEPLDPFVIYPSPRGQKFMPFQEADMEYILERKKVILGDEPGLGKTMVAIGTANALGAEKILVVCPASGRLNWRKHIRNWSTLRDVSTYPVMKGLDGVNPYANYTLISYDLARSQELWDALDALDWDMVVFDEAHYLKSHEAKRTVAMLGSWDRKKKGLIHRVPYVLPMTGTPLPNRPRECYTIMRALCWDAIDFMTYDQFQYRFNPSMKLPSGKTREMRGRLPELQMRLRCNIMVRHLQKDVLKDLPPLRYEIVYVEPTGAIRKVIKAETLLQIDPTDLLNVVFDTDAHISTLRREMGEAMVPRVIEHVVTMLEGGVEKLLLFGHHKGVIAALEKALEHYGLVKIIGATPVGRRAEIAEAFQNDPRIRIFLGQMQAAGEIIDLYAASHVVFAEPSWVSKDNIQCAKRAHRYGQLNSVLAQFLVAEGSFSEIVLGTAVAKYHVIDQTLDQQE